MEFSKLNESLEYSIKSFPSENAQIIKKQIEQLPAEFVLQLENLYNSENDLEQAYENIGNYAGQGAWGVDALKEGKRIFNNLRHQLQQNLCNYKPLRLYCENTNVIDGLSVAGIVLGGLLASKTANIDVVSAALIISRIGIKNFCKSNWQIPPNE
jgi:hypothetical protein